MLTRLSAAVDRWAVVWWPRAASDAALVARYDRLAAELRDQGGRGMVLLAQIGPVAREIERRGLWPMTRRYWAGPGI